MENKPYYRVIDGRGRLYLPAESRVVSGIQPGDIVRLDAHHGRLDVQKVELIEVGDQSPEALAAYIMAGVPYLAEEQLRDIFGQVLSCLQTKTGGNEK